MEQASESRETIETFHTTETYALDDEISTEFFEEILEDEESLNVVYEIREELMDRVMDEIYKIYLDKQVIRFVVQCAYEAMLKFLSIRFYYHDPIPNPLSPRWKPDEPIPPSPPDTWAAGSVAVRPKPRTINLEELATSGGPADSISMAEASSCFCTDDEDKCICMEAGPNLESLDFKINRGSTETVDERALSDILAGSLLSDRSISATTKQRSLTKAVRRPKLSSTTSANKQYGSEETPAYFQFTAGKKRQMSVMRKLPRKLTKEEIKLPKIELPTYKVKDSKTSLLELPPIRSGGKFTVPTAEENVNPKPEKKK